MSEVVDAEVVPEHEAAPPAPVPATPAPSTAMAPRPTREALIPLDADAVIAGMDAYQKLLPRLLDASDYQAADGKRFVKKSGWRKIARAFNLSVELVGQPIVERDDDGHPTRASAVARAIAPNGQVQDGDGYCSVDESRFARAQGRQKLENDLRTTATTRAKNRAISDLVGMGEVSAEEVDAGGQSAAPVASPALVDGAKQACRDLGGEHARLLYNKCAPENVLPAAVGNALVYAAAAAFAAHGVPKQPDPAQAAADVPADTEGLPAA